MDDCRWPYRLRVLAVLLWQDGHGLPLVVGPHDAGDRAQWRSTVSDKFYAMDERGRIEDCSIVFRAISIPISMTLGHTRCL